MKKEDDQLNAFIANKQSGNRIIALLPVNCLSGISAQNNHSPSQHLIKVDTITVRLKQAYNTPAFSYTAQRQRLYVYLTTYQEEPCLHRIWMKMTCSSSAMPQATTAGRSAPGRTHPNCSTLPLNCSRSLVSISRKLIQITLESYQSNLGNPADDGVSGSQAEASSNGGKITTASAQERY